jgi:hypothetical protein
MEIPGEPRNLAAGHHWQHDPKESDQTDFSPVRYRLFSEIISREL